MRHLNSRAVIFEQRREPTTNAEIFSHLDIGRVKIPHEFAFVRRHHFKREFVVIAKKGCPLTIFGNRRRLRQHPIERLALPLGEREKNARHQGKVKVHLKFVAIAKVRQRIFCPLIRFGEKHRAGRVRVEKRAQAFVIRVRFGQIFAVRAFAFDEVRRRVHANSIRALIHPKLRDTHHRFLHFRVVKIQIGLMIKKAMPIILPAQFVKFPIRRFVINKNDARLFIFLIRVAPHIPVAIFFMFGMIGIARCLEPRMLVAGVIGDEFDNDAQTARVRGVH